jgi:Protein of unknown function (DUF2946)
LTVTRRKLILAWLALALNAAAPLFAYAHIQLDESGQIVELCATNEPGQKGDKHHHPGPKKSTVPHCQYCPGFSAGATLAPMVVYQPPRLAGSTQAVFSPLAAACGRSSVRIAQPRGPPNSF